jgi:hypothetical protein
MDARAPAAKATDGHACRGSPSTRRLLRAGVACRESQSVQGAHSGSFFGCFGTGSYGMRWRGRLGQGVDQLKSCRRARTLSLKAGRPPHYVELWSDNLDKLPRGGEHRFALGPDRPIPVTLCAGELGRRLSVVRFSPPPAEPGRFEAATLRTMRRFRIRIRVLDFVNHPHLLFSCNSS